MMTYNRTKCWGIGIVSVVGLFALSVCTQAQRVSIVEAPAAVPIDTGLGQYSPRVAFGYFGLATGSRYTLRVWLLETSGWLLGSTQWSPKAFTLDNTTGNNATGTIEVESPFDVYAYPSFRWVARLYNASGLEVSHAEQNAVGTANRAPILNTVGRRQGVVGQPLEFAVSAIDPDGNALGFSCVNLPAGATLDGSTGRFSWTAAATQTVTVIFVVTDNGEGRLSDAEIVTIDISCPPVITSQPLGQVLKPGGTASFSAVVTSPTPVRYQWKVNGCDIAGATNAAWNIPAVTVSNAGLYLVVASNAAGTTISREAALVVYTNRTREASARASVEHLNREMDEYHSCRPVYYDIGSGGNTYHAPGKIPDQYAAVSMNGSWTNRVHSGATSIRFAFTNVNGSNYGGYYLMSGLLVSNAPVAYFGTATNPVTGQSVETDTGLDLTGATNLSFWAATEHGVAVVEFFVGGVGRDPYSGTPIEPYFDSCPRTPAMGAPSRVTITTNWQEIVIPLIGQDLTNIMGGFGWIASATLNPGGAVFMVDDIQFNLDPAAREARLNQPRFLRSFSTLPRQPPVLDPGRDDQIDFILRSAAFLYDQCLAVLLYLHEGSADSLRRARLIGQAILYAQRKDRRYTDGRLRTCYAAGDLALPRGWLPNGIAGSVAVPGFYVEDSHVFVEIENRDIDTGNSGWGIVCLVALERRFPGEGYLEAAIRVAEFVESTQRCNSGLYQGYLGGIMNAESSAATNRTYASTEGNLDLVAGFAGLYDLTGDAKWLDAKAHAEALVEATYDPAIGGYLAGTIHPDLLNRLAGQLPSDTQVWNVLVRTNVLSLHPDLLTCPETRMAVAHCGFAGIDFNDDRDGVAFEITGQLAAAYGNCGRTNDWERVCEELLVAQQMPAPIGDGMGTVSSCHEGVTSGFGFSLYRRMSLAATAWSYFGVTKSNPFYELPPKRVTVISSPATTNIALGQTLTFTVWATNSDGATPTLAASLKPVAATFTDNGDGTGTFSWMPTRAEDVGENLVRFVATVGELAATNDTIIRVLSFQVTDPTNEAVIRCGDTFTVKWVGAWVLGHVNVSLWNGTNFIASLTNNLASPATNMTAQVGLPVGLVPGRDYRIQVQDAANPYTQAASARFRVSSCARLFWQLPSGQAACWMLNGDGTIRRCMNIFTAATTWQICAAGYVNRDGIADLVWRLPASGQTATWLLNDNATADSSFYLFNGSTAWQVRGVGDIDGDGTSDVIWQLPTGQVALWLMNGNGTRKAAVNALTVTTPWIVRGIGDVDGDGTPDLAWQLPTGQTALWMMNSDGTRKAVVSILTATTSWIVRGLGDIDGDGTTDLIWQLPTGQVAAWLMNPDGSRRAGLTIYAGTTSWIIRGVSQ